MKPDLSLREGEERKYSRAVTTALADSICTLSSLTPNTFFKASLPQVYFLSKGAKTKLTAFPHTNVSNLKQRQYPILIQA